MNQPAVPRSYRAFGLHIQSALAIPGAQRIAASVPPDLIVEEGRIDHPEAGIECGPYRLIGANLLFTMPGVARYLCSDRGTRLVVEPLPHASQDEVAAMLIATALPAILWMRGEIVLHAATAVLPGHTRAIAFAGASGSGKSTILRSLLAAGAVVVSEDTLCVRQRADIVEASGLPACTFRYRPDLPAAERLEIAVPADSQAGHAALGALLVLTPSDTPQSLELKPLPQPRALAALLTHLHRPRVPRLLDLERALLPRFASLARSFPICNCPIETPDSPGFAENFLLRLRNMHGYLL